MGRSAERIELEPIMTFPMRGLGYLRSRVEPWVGKGELGVGTAAWTVDDLDPTEPWNVRAAARPGSVG
jgi:hypothetical protein